MCAKKVLILYILTLKSYEKYYLHIIMQNKLGCFYISYLLSIIQCQNIYWYLEFFRFLQHREESSAKRESYHHTSTMSCWSFIICVLSGKFCVESKVLMATFYGTLVETRMDLEVNTLKTLFHSLIYIKISMFPKELSP